MKKLCLFVSLLISISSFSQSISGDGNKDIDVEVLSSIIQKKQIELATRLFKNSIIRYFENKGLPSKAYFQDVTRLNNMATYGYFYTMGNEIFSEKNKKKIAETVVKESVKYFFVYSFAVEIAKDSVLMDTLNIAIDRIVNNGYGGLDNKIDTFDAENIISGESIDTKASILFNRIRKRPGAKTKNANVFGFNILMDIIYDVIVQGKDKNSCLNEIGFPISSEWKSFIKFSEFYDKNNFFSYYNNHNDLDSLRGMVKRRLVNICCDINSGSFENISNPYVKAMSILLKFNKAKLSQNAIDTFRILIRDYIDRENDRASSYSEYNFIPSFLICVENNISYDDSTKKLDIDVQQIIGDLYEYYYKISGKHTVNFLFNMGFNYTYFLNSEKSLIGNGDRNIIFAAEKIGFKVKLFNWYKTRSYKAGQWFKQGGVYKSWIVNKPETALYDIYWQGYTSGILYNLVNVKSNNKFNFAVIGTGLGANFYNGLNISANVGIPLSSRLTKEDWTDNIFFSLGVDIPIFDYLKGLRSKNLAAKKE